MRFISRNGWTVELALYHTSTVRNTVCRPCCSSYSDLALVIVPTKAVFIRENFDRGFPSLPRAHNHFVLVKSSLYKDCASKLSNLSKLSKFRTNVSTVGKSHTKYSEHNNIDEQHDGQHYQQEQQETNPPSRLLSELITDM